MAAFLLAVTAAIAGVAAREQAQPFQLSIDTRRAVAQVDKRETSITWDIYGLQPNPMRRNAPFDLEDQFLRGLIANLHPFVLRISGTGCENVVFGSAGNTTVPAAVSKLLRPNGGGTAPFNAAVADWDRVVGFAKATGADMVVGLNLLLREWPQGGAHGCAPAGSADCAWDPTNARTWLEHNRDTAAPVAGYELGNEPGCFMPQVNLSGARVAADFGLLRQLVADVYTTPGARPLVIGPDVGGCWKGGQGPRSIEPILSHHAPLDVIAFHHYVLGGSKTARYTVSDFVAAALSNITRSTVQSYAAARQEYMPQTPMWLGEGATTYSQPLDASFATLYNYIDILAETGLAGVGVFAMQSIGDLFQVPSGNRAGPTPAHTPTAPFWGMVLWKRLMGPAVYSVDAGDARGMIIVAARSLRNGTGGAVSIALANLAAEDRSYAVQLNGARQTPTVCEVYLVEPATDPSGAYVLINGNVPQYDAVTGTVPPIPPRKLLGCDAITVPSLSVAFVVVR